MTAGEVGERYTELGGQVADASEKERGLRHVAKLREQLDTSLCAKCKHPNRMHDQGVCFFPTPPRGEDCSTCGNETKEEPVSAPTKDTP